MTNYTRGAATLVVLAATLLGACATNPAVRFDTAARASIRTIGIAAAGVPEQADVRVLAHADPKLGLVGYLVEEGRESAAREELAATLAREQFDFRDVIPAYIGSALTTAGFQTVELPTPRAAGERGKFLKTLPAAGEVDAVLDVVVLTLGFFATEPNAPYQAGVHVAARLVDVRTRKVLFQNEFVYGEALMAQVESAGVNAIPVTSPDAAMFRGRTGLRANGQATRDALRRALASTIAEIGLQLQTR
jgi:hypothetical protein